MKKINFSDKIKLSILSRYKTKTSKQKLTLLYGLFLFSNVVNVNKIEHKSNLEEIIIFYQQHICQITKKTIRYRTSLIRNKEYYSIISNDSVDNINIIKYLSYINREILNEEYIKNVIEGIFIACGNILETQNKYYLEFVNQNQQLIYKLKKELNKIGFQFKYKYANNKNILYITNSNLIEDFLTYMGASKSSLEIMNVKVYKNLRNRVNRLVNCETSNINKIISASAYQIKCINKIIINKGLDHLDRDLKEIAVKRLDNPEMSLSELTKVLSFKISKSGLNYKLKKIESISKQM